MRLRKEVVNRLVLAKSILLPWTNVSGSQLNDHLIARQLLGAHDAADLVFAAIADQKGKLPATGRSPSMMECLGLLDSKGLRHAAYFKQLNEARNSLKHAGNLPNSQQWSSVAEDVLERLSNLCGSVLGKRLERISELELVFDDEVRGHLEIASQFRRNGSYDLALEEIGKALCLALQDQPDLWAIEVGKPKAEDALKLTAFGIGANDFLRLQEFLPEVSKFFSEPFQIFWEQSKFGHPGNWRKEVVDFCLEQCRAIVIASQSSSSSPHAFPFEALYRYQVTAKEDAVEVWGDLVEGHLDEIANGSRPFREHKRYLKIGESVEVSALAQPLISDDLSPSGEWIKRVRVSMDEFSALLGEGRGEFVDLAKVSIVCIPHVMGSLLPQFRNLKQIEWTPDPDLQRELSHSQQSSASISDAASDAGRRDASRLGKELER